MAVPILDKGLLHEIMAVSGVQSFEFEHWKPLSPSAGVRRPSTARCADRQARTCGRAVARGLADAGRERDSIISRQKSPLFCLRTCSSPAVRSKSNDGLLSWGAGDMASACVDDLANAGDTQDATRKNWRPVSARTYAPGQKCNSRAPCLPLSAAGTPRPSGPSSCRANTRPTSAREHIQLASHQSYVAKTNRPPSAPARPHAHQPSSLKKPDILCHPAHSRPIPRRERSFNKANSSLNSQRAQQEAASIGACLPRAWTPPSSHAGRDDEMDEVTFARAEKLTNVRLPRKRVVHRKHTNMLGESDAPQQADAAQLEGDGVIQRTASLSSSRNGSAGHEPEGRKSNPTKSRKGVHERKSLFDKNEKLVGMHVKSANLKKGETKVVYSQNYVAIKDLEDDEIFEKGTGTVIGWDPDGLMTDVEWEDGTTEYCCTGYNRLYYLALKIVVDVETGAEYALGWEDPGKKMISTMASYPDWLVLGEQENPFPSKQDELGEGISRVPKTADFRVIKDQWDELSTQRRIKKLKIKSMREGKDVGVFDKALQISRRNMRQLEKEQQIMSDWIVSDINGVEIKVPPSSLAPPAPALVTCDTHKRPSLVDQVYHQVRRDAEKARRQARLEREAERERIRLERKAFKVSKKGDPGGFKAKELADAAAKNKRKQSRLHMDPLEAVLTANDEELDTIFNDTFTLYDFDFSDTMDFSEFEQAMESMGVKSQPDTLHALVAAMDSDGNGTLDLSEFKMLARELIATAKEFKDDANKKKQLQALNRRRKAAGQAPLARLPEARGSTTKTSDETDSGTSHQPGKDIVRSLMKEQFDAKAPEKEPTSTGEEPRKTKNLWKAVLATTVVTHSVGGK